MVSFTIMAIFDTSDFRRYRYKKSQIAFLAMMFPTQTWCLTLNWQNEIGSSNELNFRHLLHLEDK